MQTKIFSNTKNKYLFNSGKYFSEGFEIFKRDPLSLALAYFLCVVLSFVPFCSLLAIGNFYKICKDIDEGKKADVGVIFDFKDFLNYLKFQIFLVGLVFLLMIPIQMFLFPSLFVFDGIKNISPDSLVPILGGSILFFFLMLFLLIGVIASALHFVMPLISIHKMVSVRESISVSWSIAKKRIFEISLFVIVLYFLSLLGVLFCFIGIFITAPIALCIKYASYKDLLVELP